MHFSSPRRSRKELPRPDRLDHFLDSLVVQPPASPPPAGFIGAVARRRFQRRFKRVSIGAACLVVVAAAAFLIPRQPAVPSSPRIVSPPAPARESMMALVHANPTFDADHLRLPETPAALSASGPRLGLRLDPAEIERWAGE